MKNLKMFVPARRRVTSFEADIEYGLPGWQVMQKPELVADWYLVTRKDRIFKGSDFKDCSWEILGLIANRGREVEHDGEQCLAVRPLNLRDADFCEMVRSRVAESLGEPVESIEFRGVL
jgi:hypothetical protein